MNGAPWGLLTGWLRIEADERATRYGRTVTIADVALRRRPVDAGATVHRLPGRAANVDQTAA